MENIKIGILAVHFLITDIILRETGSYDITKRLIDDFHKNNNSLEGLDSWSEINQELRSLLWKKW